ncbi:MAG TPA: ATP-binding protein [Anaerolineae bacterium]|nr:ATP-binding protein [Anaerolineae bacterium]
MSIRLRLSLIYTGVLAVVFLAFSIAVYARVRATLLIDIDRSLEQAALAVIDQTTAQVSGDTTFIQFPNDEQLGRFQTASTFIVAIDQDGDVVATSNNLGDFRNLLDPNGLRDEQHYSIISYANQTMRVLTAPLITESFADRRVGYIQVARVLEGYEATLSNLTWTLILAGWAAVCLSLFLEDLLTHNSLKPLYNIARIATHINKADDLSRRIPDDNRRDEFGRLAQVLNETLERLEMIFRAQQRLLADVSHELRTPLTTIRGNVDLMRRMGDRPDPESLDAIQEETDRMTRLVSDLLLLARADAGELPLQKHPVQLDTILGEVYRQIQRLSPTMSILITEFDQVTILGDEDRLKQVIFNLINNAMKYTPPDGQISLSLQQDADHAYLSISDTGEGIPPEDLPHIFERFYRVDKARARQKGGSGLGLSIVHWIVKAHQGDITVSSQPQQGTTFKIVLPLHHQPLPPPSSEAIRSPQTNKPVTTP